MNLYACYFSFPGGDNRWQRMAAVLRNTAAAHGLTETVEELDPPQLTRGASFCANHAKLKVWCDRVQEATEPLILTDTDIIIQADPSPAFEQVRHVGVTYRDQGGYSMPLNAGVVFVRPTDHTKAFFRAWVEADRMMWENGRLLQQWCKKYAGLNQSSLGMLVETGKWDIDRLPCSTWNLVEPWEEIDKARIIHIKGAAMAHIFNPGSKALGTINTLQKIFEHLENA